MLSQLMRERRRKKWRSMSKWQKRQRQMQRLEKQLAKLKKELAPDEVTNHNGIQISLTRCRDRSGRLHEFFVFEPKDPYFGPSNKVHRKNLAALREAIIFADWNL